MTSRMSRFESRRTSESLLNCMTNSCQRQCHETSSPVSSTSFGKHAWLDTNDVRDQSDKLSDCWHVHRCRSSRVSYVASISLSRGSFQKMYRVGPEGRMHADGSRLAEFLQTFSSEMRAYSSLPSSVSIFCPLSFLARNQKLSIQCTKINIKGSQSHP